jgi:glycosyltransferase involved in cell wall biosynthesis
MGKESPLQQESPIDLSVVILCYRAEEAARPFVQRTREVLQAAGIEDYELVLVGNYIEGIADETPRIVAELAAEDWRVRHVARPKAGMMGWDMRCGLELTRGRHLAIIDGDGQFPIEDLVRVYRVIRVDDLDIVKTYRLRRGDGWQRRTVSFLYNLLFAFLFPGTFSRDVNSKPKILTRKAYESLDLRSDDWFIDAEMIVQARDRGLRIGEIPTSFHGLSGRRSFVKPAAALEFIKNLLLYRIKEFFRS